MNERNWPSEEEPEESITFHCEDIDFMPDRADDLLRWIHVVLEKEKAQLSFVNFIFCSDEYLYQLNVEYLNHDTYTDIITFPYTDPPLIEGDVFISIDRVRDNATQLALPFDEELHRVLIHGILHLCGYLDKSPEDKDRMTQKENEALALRQTSFTR